MQQQTVRKLGKSENKGVLVIYVGGTIGSMPRNESDPESPQIVKPWKEVFKRTPELWPENIGFHLGSYDFQPPLDSCNIGPQHWAQIAKVIKRNYDDYEGFVVLHGTDTMVYTASALSFMLVNLGKPVVITGAVRSGLFQVRNDAKQNIVTSLLIANPRYSGIPIVPEVCIFFRDKLLRGNRAKKINAGGYDCYDSPNYPPLGLVGEKIIIDQRVTQETPTSDKPFAIRTKMETNVIALDVFPGINESVTVSRIFSYHPPKGIILKSYGAGNIPTQEEFLQIIQKATNSGVVIQVVTQCVSGMVDLALYETGSKLIEAGVVSGLDMTSEAALCKLMLLLGDKDSTPGEVALRTQQNISGEQNMSIYTIRLNTMGDQTLKPETPKFRFKKTNVRENWGRKPIEKAYLRFWEFKVDALKGENISIKIWINLDIDNDYVEDSPLYAGALSLESRIDSSYIQFDVTDIVRLYVTPGKWVSFTLILSSAGYFSWGNCELVIFTKELTLTQELILEKR